MGARWPDEAVAGLAPDASSLSAGRRLATPSSWTGLGATSAAVWGLCAGSGKNPYQTIVDLDGPAFRCSCPSRKFPCKHALGLLLLWSADRVPDVAEPADFAATWLESRAAKSAAPPRRAESAGEGPVDPAAAERRAEQRAARVAAGLDDLDRWLCDQVRVGLVSVDRSHAHVDGMAARLVDAQAPGVASWLRRIPASLVNDEQWPRTLLQQYGQLHLLARAHASLETLPADLSATVRSHVGYTTAKEDVLATEPVRDRWCVVAVRDTTEDRLMVRRAWLVGERTGRYAVVLSFAATGQVLDTSLLAGTSVEASLHLYPGTPPLRALVGERHSEPGEPGPLPGTSVDEAAAAYAEALAADPWLRSWPALLDGVAVGRGTDGAGWCLHDDSGTLPIAPGAGDPWVLLAVSGGRPVPLMVELTDTGAVPLSVVGDAVVAL
ncbi:MAG TPA: SWIM zinc finger family protein [Candidatus Nanopelagicales bacterium]|nr:SWIM zinc finger family protein [Candidatus Nanopelagicales bacterium]